MYIYDFVIMETEKSHDLPSASWRPRKASGVICPGASTVDGINPSPRAAEDEMRDTVQVVRKEKGSKILQSPSLIYSGL